MELRQLEYFKTVGDMKSLSKASEMLYISQPALSKSISSLEKELGVQLFERRNRKMILTTFGQMFYHRTIRLLKELDASVAEIKRISGQTSSVLTISTIMPEFFTPIATMYHRRNSGVIIREYNNFAISAKEALVYGDINFCLTPVAFDHPSLVWFSLCEEEMLLIAPNSYSLPLVDGKVLLPDLEQAPFLTTPSGTNHHQCTTAFCKSAGFDPYIVVETPSIDTISMLVTDGCGVAFMSETVHRRMSGPRLDPNRPPYQVFHVLEPNCLRNVGIAMRRDQSLSDLEYDFLMQLFFFFRPQAEQNSALLKNNAFVQYLNAHHFFPETADCNERKLSWGTQSLSNFQQKQKI